MRIFLVLLCLLPHYKAFAIEKYVRIDADIHSSTGSSSSSLLVEPGKEVHIKQINQNGQSIRISIKPTLVGTPAIARPEAVRLNFQISSAGKSISNPFVVTNLGEAVHINETDSKQNVSLDMKVLATLEEK